MEISFQKCHCSPGFRQRQLKDNKTCKDQTLEGNLTVHDTGLLVVINAMVSYLIKRHTDTTAIRYVLNAIKVANLKLWPTKKRYVFPTSVLPDFEF